MAVMLNCDRCGKIYPFPTWRQFGSVDPTSINFGFRDIKNPTAYEDGEDDFDLCPDCMKQLKEFLETESEDEHGEDKDGGH